MAKLTSQEIATANALAKLESFARAQQIKINREKPTKAVSRLNAVLERRARGF